MLVFLPLTCYASKADDAFTSLKKFRARCQTGISYREYGAALADAQYQVNEYAASGEADRNREFGKLLLAALNDYRRAGVLWDWEVKISNSSSIYEDDGIWPGFLAAYPNAVEILHTEGCNYREHGRCVRFHEALSYLWNQAGDRLDKASLLVPQKRKNSKR